MSSALNRRAVLAVALLALATAAMGRPSGAHRDDALFRRHPAAEVYRGPVHLPDFRNQDRAFFAYRTRIRKGMAGGANFAGHYALIGWGCGTECMTYVVGDVMTGRVFEFPLRSEGHQELRLDARLASRAVIARWVRYTDKDSSDNLPIVNCLRQDFVWNGISAEALAKPVVVATVKSDELEQCDN